MFGDWVGRVTWATDFVKTPGFQGDLGPRVFFFVIEGRSILLREG